MPLEPGCSRRRLEGAAEERDALAHPRDAVASLATIGRLNTPDVSDRQLEDARVVGHADVGPRSGRMLAHVRERLLHDPERRQVEALAKLSRRALHGEVDLEPGVARLLDELAQVREPGSRRATRRVVALAQKLER